MVLAPENLCDILRDALNNRYITLPCSHADSAGKILAQEPEALILSLQLPGMDGLTFLKDYSLHLPPVVMVLSTCFDDALLEQLHALGVSAVVSVPCRLSCLFQQLDMLLAKKCPSR